MESLLRPALHALRLPTPRVGHATACHPCLHTLAPRAATPLPHPSVAGPPPPESPLPRPSEASARAARKRRQADLLKQAQHARAAASTPAAKPRSMLQKRFWKDVVVKEADRGFHICLDGRPVRAPNKHILTVPASKPQLATAVALEWDLLVSAQQALKTHYIPMTSLAARALDIELADAQGKTQLRTDVLKMLMRHLDTDTLLCWAPAKVLNESLRNGQTLRQLQEATSLPIIAYLQAKVWPGVEIRPILDAESIMPVSQSSETQQVIRAWLSALPAFELAGLERAVLASKSLLVSARLIYEWGQGFAQSPKDTGAGRFGIEEAAEACSLEVRWQTGQWGEVEDTHDVEKEDLRRQLGSAVVLVSGESA